MPNQSSIENRSKAEKKAKMKTESKAKRKVKVNKMVREVSIYTNGGSSVIVMLCRVPRGILKLRQRQLCFLYDVRELPELRGHLNRISNEQGR